MNYWNFECNKPLKCPNCTVELSVVNIIQYTLSIKTSNYENSGTTEPIYIQFIGTSGKTPEKLLSEKGFGKGSLMKVTIDSIDVGSVYGIILHIKGYDCWRPEEIIVKKPGINSINLEEKIFKIPPSVMIDSPVKPYTLKLPKPEFSNLGEEEKSTNSNSLLDSKDQQSIL
jgi:PLAT/LH2 domain